MACPAQDITDTELSIMETLWDKGPLTTRQITDILYPNGAASHYATVQSLLARLEEKSLVTKSRDSRAHVCAAAVDRSEVIGRRLKTLAERFCSGSLSPLLTHLLQAEKLTAAEKRELRKLLDDGVAKKAGSRERK